MTTSDDVTRRLAEIADRTNRRVTQQGTRLDAHERQLAGLRKVAGTVVGHTGDISRIDERLIEINTSLEHASGRAELAATAAIGAHDRLDGHENRLDGLENWLDGGFNWIFWGGISAIGFVSSVLFWRVMMYGFNWHPWLADRGGPEYWQNHNPGVLNAHWWILVLVTTGLIAGIAWIILSFVGRGGQQNNTANTTEPTTTRQAEEVEVVHVGPFGPAGTAPVAPEPPAGHTDTSVFSPDQQPALR